VNGRQLDRPSCRLQENIKQTECQDVDQDRVLMRSVVNMRMDLRLALVCTSVAHYRAEFIQLTGGHPLPMAMLHRAKVKKLPSV
jgi:hypothetical protein